MDDWSERHVWPLFGAFGALEELTGVVRTLVLLGPDAALWRSGGLSPEEAEFMCEVAIEAPTVGFECGGHIAAI